MSTVWVFLPATVVGRIVSGATVENLIFTVLAFTAGLMLLNGLLSYLYSTVWLRRNIQRVKISFDVRDKAISTDYANLETQAFSDARTKAQSNMYISNDFYQAIESLGINLLGLVVFLSLLATANPLVIALSVATATLGVLVRNWANNWRFRHDNIEAEFEKRIFHINYLGQEYGIGKDIRLFKMAYWVQSVFCKNIEQAYKFTSRVELRQWFADAAGALGDGALDTIVYAYLIWQVLSGNIAVDEFMLLAAAVYAFSTRVAGILGVMAELNNISLRFCRIREFLDFPDKFRRGEGEPISPGKIPYSLTLENISLRYSGAADDTLQNVNLHIEPGENLAIVGLNGSGKTTLVKLLCGLYDPTEGAVRLNGRDIRDFNRLHYYKLFTAVFQDFNILPNSIAENVAQEVDEEVDTARVMQCLETAELTEKITSFPNGIHSLLVKEVNLDAVALSGGETQKLMLARALYKDAPILILDEPTAALDPIAESRLYERYNELSKGRTSIYISHRLASTRFCDRIILVEGKGIAEMGTHDELVAKGGKYAELFEIQGKYYREEHNSGTQSDI